MRAKAMFGDAMMARNAEIAKAYGAGEPQDEIAKRYGIAPKTVQKIATDLKVYKPGHKAFSTPEKPGKKRKWGRLAREKRNRREREIVEGMASGKTIEEAMTETGFSRGWLLALIRRVERRNHMSKQGTRDNVIADAARMGFMQKHLPPDFRRIQWTLQCSKCPQVYTAHWEINMKPEAMARAVRTRGWDADYGMRPLCPNCLHKKDKGPVAKPDNQSFDRFVPPPTSMFDALLDASNERAKRASIPTIVSKLVNAELDHIDAEAQKRDAAERAAMNQRLLERRKRIAQAHEQREQRLAQERIDRAARCGTEAPELAPADQSLPEEPVPQADNAPQAEEEVMNMPTISPTPSPKITHAVFQVLDDVFDVQKRLYKNGYTDMRVAKDCGTSEAVVAYLRNETFGALAEDPRISNLRDDLELLRMESAEVFARLQKQIGEAQSRLEQIAHSK